jgi:hypothetical protein
MIFRIAYWKIYKATEPGKSLILIIGTQKLNIDGSGE